MLATIYESPGSSPPLGTTATHHAFQYDPFARQIHAISSTNAGRSDRRGTSSPDIITVTEPPPNPYADNKIPAEKKLFLKLLARRLRVTQRADRGMTVERAAGEGSGFLPTYTVAPRFESYTNQSCCFKSCRVRVESLCVDKTAPLGRGVASSRQPAKDVTQS